MEVRVGEKLLQMEDGVASEVKSHRQIVHADGLRERRNVRLSYIVHVNYDNVRGISSFRENPNMLTRPAYKVERRHPVDANQYYFNLLSINQFPQSIHFSTNIFTMPTSSRICLALSTATLAICGGTPSLTIVIASSLVPNVQSKHPQSKPYLRR